LKTWTQIIQNVYKQKRERNWKEIYYALVDPKTIGTKEKRIMEDNWS